MDRRIRNGGDGDDDDDDDGKGKKGGVVGYIQDIILLPVHILTSPPALRTYLRTILLLLTSIACGICALLAYSAFYYAYIPIRGLEVPVYLQYASTSAAATLGAKHPYGIADIQGLVSRQKYDVVVDMEVPRSAANVQRGNWMVGVEMRGGRRGGAGIRGGVLGVLGWEEEDGEVFKRKIMPGHGNGNSGADVGEEKKEGKHVVLARSTRPAILTYRSWMTEVAYRFLRLPLYVVGWKLEAEKICIGMMEGVSFDKGWENVPSSLRLEVRSALSPLEVYSVKVRFIAKLEGLRWLMYQHRIVTAIAFTSLFWGVEMGVLLMTWAAFSLCFTGMDHDDDEPLPRRKIKSEVGPATPRLLGDEISEPPTPMSDTSRTFPTLSSQQPLQYTSSQSEAKVKDERATPGLESVPVKVEEADDEEDDFLLEEPGGARARELDSGIGTGRESSTERGRGSGVRGRRGG
ncbi:hypothetical protein P280DRAFT_535950 [Massarina eburnea CBS 473.64]|uniref:Adipose-regulatory protein-domain-containing protein n=1 Tax=Massarina eburnea CBS 473.64 TaxID=1395130 RepID=A0A6A6SDC8_9PLEO|nr:hypothetical protein P280DRAFT_535950 [Massarina eburnea CBS 473.64]